MAKRSSILEDLVRFSEIAGQLEQVPAPSIRAVAESLGVSAPAVQDCIRRVESHLGGVALVQTAEKVGAATRLTAEGVQYLQQVRQLINWRPDAPNLLRLVLSHTLLTSQLLTPAVTEFQERYKIRVALRPTTATMEFHQIVRELQTDRLDAAILWESKERASHSYPGVEMSILNYPFDLVFISRRQHEVMGTPKDVIAQLSRKRLITLRAGHQHMIEDLPPPDAAAGGERMEADTIDAIIACIRAGAGDIGLIPADYGVLEPLRLIGQVYFSDPICVVRLLCFRRRGATGYTLDLVPFIQTQLNDLPRKEKASTIRPADAKFPSRTSFYERFAFAYYIDHPRDPGQDDSFEPPRWNWEEVKLRTDIARSMDEKTQVFEGEIRNSYGDTFVFTARLVGETLFYVHAHSPEERPRASVSAFIAVFAWCGTDGDNGLMYGHWSGTKPPDNHPALYATIWSWKPLDLKDLRRLSNHVKVRTILDIDSGHAFDQQPRASTLGDRPVESPAAAPATSDRSQRPKSNKPR